MAKSQLVNLKHIIKMNQISPLAYVHPEAKLGDNNIIGPFCYIDRDVEIGDNNVMQNSVTIHVGARQQQRVLPRSEYLYKATRLEVPWRGGHLYRR